MGRYNLVVPIAGKGRRMAEGGFTMPKPMILAGDRTIVEWAMDSVDYSDCNIIFVILKEHACNFAMDEFLESKYPGCTVLQIDEVTGGSVETVLQAKELIEEDVPLIVLCSDIYFWPKYIPRQADFVHPGFLLTFKANSPNYSYVLKEDGFVTQTREKVVISQDAAVGLYCFDSGYTFVRFAQDMIDMEQTEHGEYFMSPLYNLLLDVGMKVASREIDNIYIMGTPQEFKFFERVVFPYLNGPQKFIVCSDHSGYITKLVFQRSLNESGYIPVDCGCHSEHDCDYWDYLNLAQKYVLATPGSIGLGFCRSGQGMNIAANKIPGIRSALVGTPSQARLAIEHNAANFFAIPEEAGYLSREITDAILQARFQGGRHQNRLQKVES